MMIMPDADLDKAADALIGAGYGSAGERCMAISVAVMVGDVGDRLIPMLADRVRDLKIGNGMNDDSEMGPIVSAAAKEKITGYIANGEEQGATMVVDGRDQKVPAHRSLAVQLMPGASPFFGRPASSVAPSFCWAPCCCSE